MGIEVDDVLPGQWFPAISLLPLIIKTINTSGVGTTYVLNKGCHKPLIFTYLFLRQGWKTFITLFITVVSVMAVD